MKDLRSPLNLVLIQYIIFIECGLAWMMIEHVENNSQMFWFKVWWYMSHKLDYIKRFVKRCLLLGCYLVIGNTKGTRKKKQWSNWKRPISISHSFQFKPFDNQPLLTVGKRFKPGSSLTHLCKPTSIAVATTGEVGIEKGKNTKIYK